MKVVICTAEQFQNKQGIHLLSPDLWYLNDALQVAERDGFETIYMHYPSKSVNSFTVPYDVMNELFSLGESVVVEFVHPVSTDKFAESVLKRAR